MEHRYGSHTAYDIEYHFVGVTKHRYKMLTGDVALRVRDLVRQTFLGRSRVLLPSAP
jgi:putative transposase